MLLPPFNNLVARNRLIEPKTAIYRGALDKVRRLQTLARQRKLYRHPAFKQPEDFPRQGTARFDFANA